MQTIHRSEDQDDLRCPECKRTITPDQAFCRHCRAAILRRYCAGCKDLVPDFTLNCPYCGTSASYKPAEIKLPEWIKVAAGVIVLFVVAILISMPDQDTVQAQLSKSVAAATDPVDRKISPDSQPAQKVAENPKAAVPATTPSDVPVDLDLGIRLNVQGHALIKQNRYQEAIPVFHRAIAAFPKSTDNIAYYYAQYNLGHSLRRIGKPQEAIPYLERCVAYDKANPMFAAELEAARRQIAR